MDKKLFSDGELLLSLINEVLGVGFGEDCSGGESCDDINTACPGTGTLECGCVANSYRKSDNSACAIIVSTLTGACDTTDTAAEQCSYANTECTADGGGGITYESACSNTVADTSQCAVTNQECSLESGTTNYKCQCTADYYGDGTGCAAKIAFGGDCSGGKECAGDNTACPGSGTIVCGCAATYYRNSGDTACVLSKYFEWRVVSSKYL
ncbi:Hypothetical predicted protein [Mytilus galloprovincialis]|uniref:EGF-like domain-containing protein n=1 Tax=Mytilus galloprovincialis TaxID=29158 RepID=A0A8B6ECB4_MYTGA|nr:Hypothetical predicted protein [Mytilus galloprovincialis]